MTIVRPAFAATPTPVPPPKGIYNPALDAYGKGVGAELLAKLIAQFLSAAFIIGGVVLLFMIIWSGIEWMTAGGEQNKLKSAQQRLTSALIGFTIIVGLRALLGFIASVVDVLWLDTLKIVWPLP